MYRNTERKQFTAYDFITPFGGHLKEDNRWVVIANSIDWNIVDDVYEKHFADSRYGNIAYPSRMAFGALYIQRKLGFTDRELVDEITENFYFQFFIGMHEYSSEPPFDASTLVYFRKRLTNAEMQEINERMFLSKAGDDSDHRHDDPPKDGDSSSDEEGTDHTGSVNSGTVIIDASCAPADIAYPTDLELCDKARTWLEVIVDHLYASYGGLNKSGKKPRTYREKARYRFLNLNKRRKKSGNKVRRELNYQLNCIERDLRYIDAYEAAWGLDALLPIEADRLHTIRTFAVQQREMWKSRIHRIEDRIVSLSQPWVRPIVRGKSKSPVEFGAKISISVVNGYSFLDQFSFDAYNEGSGEEFKGVLEQYHRRFGCYPERVLADKIYRSRENRKYCRELGIHMSGPRLGKPGKEEAEEVRQELREIGERNEVEGKFGTGKRKFGLNLIMGKLKETTQCMVSMDLFIVNIERSIRQDVLLSILQFRDLWISSQRKGSFCIGYITI